MSILGYARDTVGYDVRLYMHAVGCEVKLVL